MFALGFRNGHDIAAMLFAAGVMFASFAIAHLCSIAFPPTDGKSRIAILTSRVCLLIVIVSALWFVAAAFDYMRLFDMFKG